MFKVNQYTYFLMLFNMFVKVSCHFVVFVFVLALPIYVGYYHGHTKPTF